MQMNYFAFVFVSIFYIIGIILLYHTYTHENYKKLSFAEFEPSDYVFVLIYTLVCVSYAYRWSFHKQTIASTLLFIFSILFNILSFSVYYIAVVRESNFLIDFVKIISGCTLTFACAQIYLIREFNVYTVILAIYIFWLLFSVILDFETKFK